MAPATPAREALLPADTDPSRYRHWRLAVDGRVATLTMDVAEEGGLHPGYQLKLNSYDLGVDWELADAVTRLRFEHPEVGAVVIESGKPQVFCAGANIRMLAQSEHGFKVNFCKFTNETRSAMEDASRRSGQVYLAAISGPASGGGYELAMATEHILLVDDGNSAVSLPEVPLLGVLPGTGGLTRLTDKRRVRRDRADQFCTTAEGVRGERALDWGLVDELAPRSQFPERVRERARALAERSDRPATGPGVALAPLRRVATPRGLEYPNLRVSFERQLGAARLVLHGPVGPQPADPAAILATGADYWPLALARELDDAILWCRLNEPELGTLVLETRGDPAAVVAAEAVLLQHPDDWLVRQIPLLWARTLQRLEATARSLVAVITPGSCFAGLLLELVLAADRSFMLQGGIEGDPTPPPTLWISDASAGWLPTHTGASRLAAHFAHRPEPVAAALARRGEPLDAAAAAALGLVTATPDDIDWDDEVRVALEERASFSPDALTGMEASLRVPGAESLETKVLGRLSAWQNWVFQRPNASGPQGALRCYGTGRLADFDRRRT